MNRGLIIRRARKIGSRFVKDVPQYLIYDFAIEHLSWSGLTMFHDAEVGSILMIETVSFPYVGKLVEASDSRVVLEGAVKVLWDGRHGQYAAGNVPSSAELEKTFEKLVINLDAVIAWAVWPGKAIPKAQ